MIKLLKLRGHIFINFMCKKSGHKTTMSINFKFIILVLLILILIGTVLPSTSFTGTVKAESSDVAILEGYVWDKAIDGPAQAYTIEIDGEFFIGNTTSSNNTGYYSINIPAGDFNLKITNNDLTYYSKEFSIESEEIKRLDFRIDSADIEEGEEDEVA